ncbi:hypothetical protein [Legionella sp. CNM-4043-24]|uniref:hypothetical protein n=1 Tax=Legionella sp. CNM-4043-24 TaxID=3421646 RepID=UPI00403B2D61
MNIDAIKQMVQFSEAVYEGIDKSSFKELTEFLHTFSKIYEFFQRRELYRKTGKACSPEYRDFFDKHDSDLECLSGKTLALADSIDREFNKFRSPADPVLTGRFCSFFRESTSGSASSSQVDEAVVTRSANNDETNQDDFCGFEPGFLKF